MARSMRDREVIGEGVSMRADVIPWAPVAARTRKALLAEKGGAYRRVIRQSETHTLSTNAVVGRTPVIFRKAGLSTVFPSNDPEGSLLELSSDDGHRRYGD